MPASRLIIHLVWVVMLSALVESEAQDPLSPQSQEAWEVLSTLGETYSHLIYTRSPRGLTCEKTQDREVRRPIERLAEGEGQHPAFIAEALAAYLWQDWGRLHVEGYDLERVISEDAGPETLEPFLEAAYRQHHVCLLGIMRVLVDGYEGKYERREDGYHYDGKGGQSRYRLLAFEPRYFPGTGLFEPLGVVYAVRLADLLSIPSVRKQALERFAQTIAKRSAESGDPLRMKP